MTTMMRERILQRILFLFCILVMPLSSVLADAKTDGDKGIEEYRNGNLIAAMALLEKSAEQGYAPAQATLAYILDKAEQNSKAFHWYQQAADNNDPAGLFGLGSMYAKGEGTSPDPQKAGQLIKQAALLNHLIAMRAYAAALEHGQLGFTQNDLSAVEWYIKAADKGDSVSIRRLNIAYSKGQLGLPVDPEQASKWDAKMSEVN